jgi:hypothetical protein
MFKTSLSLVLLLTSMGTALANQSPEDRLITPTLFVKAPDNFACNLTNVSGQTGTARVRIISNGVVLSDSKVITVSPAHTANYTVPGSLLGDNYPDRSATTILAASERFEV